MVGTSWEVSTHLPPSVITALSGAEHLGEVNSLSGSQKMHERSRVKSSPSKMKEQGSSQASFLVAFRTVFSMVLPEQEPLETIFCESVISLST